MNQLQFETIEPFCIQERISRLKQRGEIQFSNYYGVDAESYLEAYETISTLVIRKKESDFYRLYVVSIDKEELKQLLSLCAGTEYVLNIPTKGFIDQWNNILFDSHFSFYAEYHRYFTKNIKYRNSAIGELALKADVDAISNLIEEYFSKYTDYIPSREELIEMIDNNEVLVSRDSAGIVCGVLLFRIEGRKCYLRMWVDKGHTGLFLLYKAYNIAFERDIHYVYFWVNAANRDVIRLHTLMGAKEDGLKDYTYIKNLK